MRRAFLYIVAGLLKAAGFMVRVCPVRRRVALLSRQSSKMSLDFRMLADQLRDVGSPVEICVCLTEPETKGVRSFMGNTLRQLKLAQTSSVVVVDGYVPAVSVPAKRDGVTVMQMWHALGAIKKFGYQCLDTPYGRSSDSARILRMHRNYDYVIAGGPWAVNSLSLAFDCGRDCICALGLPRVDYLVSGALARQRAAVRDEIIDRYPQLNEGVPTIVYAPTFRRGDRAFAQRVADEVLAGLPDVACNLVIAGHPLDGTADAMALPQHVIAGTGYRTIDLMQVGDAVITDYSAIAYEAMAMNLPVYFFVPDIDEYRKSPGLNVDPLEEYPQATSTDFATVLDAAVRGLPGAQLPGAFPVDCTRAIATLVMESL